MTFPTGTASKVTVHVGNEVVGQSTDWFDITNHVRRGWSISRDVDSSGALEFVLSNPEGKFSNSSSEDYIEIGEDFPIVLLYGSSVYFYGVIDSPPLKDDSSGSDVSVSAVSRYYLFQKEDIVRRYLLSEYVFVEDVIYDIIYEATALNSYYGITYTIPDVGERHRLLRNFIFNNRDARSCVEELLNFHNLSLHLDIDSSGNDTITVSRRRTKNVALALSSTLTEDNIVKIDRKRGSDVFFNKVKVIARNDSGQLMVAEQQDLESIQSEGLRVRPTEDIGNRKTQTEVQAYAEYLIAKYSKDNYTTTIVLDPTKFTASELWDLRPLDLVKITHTKTGIGTDQKLVVQTVNLGGNTNTLTTVSIVLNHLYRSSNIIRFEETSTVYDEDVVFEDEELVQSCLMTAMVNVYGCWDMVIDGVANPYPASGFTNGGYHGLTDSGKLLIKTNWLKNPEYAPYLGPTDHMTMRVSMIWPLKSNGDVYGVGYWAEHADGWDNETADSSSGSDYYHQVTMEYNITPTSSFNAYGLLACSRYSGTITKVGGDGAATTTELYLDDVSLLRPGMSITFKYDTSGSYTTETKVISTVDYTNNSITMTEWVATSVAIPGTHWIADCFPVAEFTRSTATTFTSGVKCQMIFNLRFVNDVDTYGASNLSVVTKKGLESIANRLRYDYFKEDPSSSADSYPTPRFLAIGLNDIPTVRTAVDDDNTALNNEIARSSDINPTSCVATTVSNSAKITSKFGGIQIPPQYVRTTLTANASSSATTIYVSSTEGMNVGDAVFFGDSGGSTIDYTENGMSADFIKELRGYTSGSSGYCVILRHGLKEAKNSGTLMTTGKILSRESAPITEIAVFDREAAEDTDSFFYLGNRTGNATYKGTISTDVVSSTSGMGYGDYQYDELNNEDTLEKLTDTPPFFFSGRATGTYAYMKGVKACGNTTVPLISLRSGHLNLPITFDSSDYYGRRYPLSDVLTKFTDDSGVIAARSISPIGDNQYTKLTNISQKETTVGNHSKWEAVMYGLVPVTAAYAFMHDHNIDYFVDKYAAHLFVFAIDNSIQRRDFKQFSFVWRGTAKSWSTTASNYKDGVNFFVWHHGDKQPLYYENDGTFEVRGRIGDAKTFDPHWEPITMLDGTNSEVDVTVASADFNPFTILHSEMSPGSDNQDGINKVGYFLSDDNRIYILAVTKYAGSVSSKKTVSIITDFAGMNIGTSNILDSESTYLLPGIDYYYDPSWDFVAWPCLDLEYDGATYQTSFKQLKCASLAQDAVAGESFVVVTGETGIDMKPGDVLLIRSGSTMELVQMKPYGFGTIDSYRRLNLTSPLLHSYASGSDIWKYAFMQTGLTMDILGKKGLPNFPVKAFKNTGILSTNGVYTEIMADVNHGATSLSVTTSSGFKKDDIVYIHRRPDKYSENPPGYEWRTVASDPTSASYLTIDAIVRDNLGGTGIPAYDFETGQNQVYIGRVSFPCTGLDDTNTLSYMVSDTLWSDGDASGSKWKIRNGTWGLQQYPWVEGTLQTADGTYLTTHMNPEDSVGTGYTGWSSYGGPGVKIEYVDRDDGSVWVTKARNMTLYDGYTSADTNSDNEVDNYPYYRLAVDVDNEALSGYGILQILSEGAKILGQDYDAYGNRTVSGGASQRHINVARNGYIYVHKDNDSLSRYYQFFVAEIVDTTSGWIVKPKYRVLEASGQTCVKSSTNTVGLTYYLDAPMFDHGTIDTYKYYDTKVGSVVFGLDVITAGENVYSDNLTTATVVGDDHFHVASTTNFEVYDLVVFDTGTKMEIVQVTSVPNGTTVNVSPPFANAFDVGTAAKYYFFDDSARVLFKASPVYEPIDEEDSLTLSARILRPAVYDIVYAAESGNMLVYSLLKSGTLYKPIQPDRSDALQVTQEVKFLYQEYDMV